MADVYRIVHVPKSQPPALKPEYKSVADALPALLAMRRQAADPDEIQLVRIGSNEDVARIDVTVIEDSPDGSGATDARSPIV